MKEILSKINLKEYKYEFEFHPTISSDEPHLHPWVTGVLCTEVLISIIIK